MKIYVNAPNENWILDRYKTEWNTYNSEHSTTDIASADIIWLLDSYTWDRIDPFLLKNKIVVSTITHIAPEKFDYDAFKRKDQFVNHYHAMCNRSADDVKKITDKPVTPLQFWVNDNIWKELLETNDLRKKYNLPKNKVLVGSFQRDTEGSDLKSPKLVKGPDIFCDYMQTMRDSIGENLEVVLAGWRRQYVIKRLEEAGIKYHYFEMCDFDMLNDLYNCIDLYVVSSRIEGGPQAIPECAITRTPIISTDVGLAPEILAPESIDNNLSLSIPNLNYAYEKVQQYKIENHLDRFVEFFKSIYNELTFSEIQ
jgi:glycosyltransferase involved in cell wall biosynthesis